jgi:predicted CXXCH cytochrome family protein
MVVGACDMCHSYADVAEHTFELKAAEEDLCERCHASPIDGPVVHEPVAQGQCLGCHDPHGGNSVELLRHDNVDELCNTCHDDVTRDRRYAHGPVATGSCSACHRSHASSHEDLLSTPGRQLCLDCHQGMAQQLDSVRYIHGPVNIDCSQCHETHASDYPGHLKQAPVDLCVSCHEHENIRQVLSIAPYQHTSVTEGQACMNCHAPHGSDSPALARDEAIKSCLICHERPIEGDDGDILVAGMAELIQEGANLHGPVRDSNCGGCHDVHGGVAPQLLIAPYPKTFYAPFEVDTYDLCFQCHTDQLVVLRETEDVTDFRNGSKNLHYLHTNKVEEGRSCRACHSTHASTNAMHVAETVPFGQWDMPINFAATATGGTCLSGCHREMSYDRVTPVTLPAPEPEAPSPEAPTDDDQPADEPVDTPAPGDAESPPLTEGTDDEDQEPS